VRTEIIVEVAAHYLFVEGVVKQDMSGFQNIAPELRGWTNTLSRLYQLAGLTVLSDRKVVTRESIAEFLSRIDGAEVSDAE
jgi:hypothetical protein